MLHRLAAPHPGLGLGPGGVDRRQVIEPQVAGGVLRGRRALQGRDEHTAAGGARAMDEEPEELGGGGGGRGRVIGSEDTGKLAGYFGW